MLMAMNKRNHSQETWFTIAKTSSTIKETTDSRTTTKSKTFEILENPQKQGNSRRQQDEPSVKVGDEDNGGMRTLGPNFTGPGPNDVICARGSDARNHTGNRRFRTLINDNIDRYSLAATKIEKSSIVSAVIDAVRQHSPNGGFVKEIDGQYFEVGDHAAREKVGQSFRDLLHTKYKSSTKAKMAKRKQRTSSPESTTNDDRNTSSPPESEASSSKKRRRLAAITSAAYYPIEPIAVAYVPAAVPAFVGSTWSQDSTQKQVGAADDTPTNCAPSTAYAFKQEVVPYAAVSVGNRMANADDASIISAAGSAMLQRSNLMLQRSSERNWVAAYRQHSDHKEAAATGTAREAGLTLQEMAFSDDAHIDWEYGPISFSRFEHTLRVASDEDLDDEQITASIFDLSDHDNTNTLVSDVAPEPERINLSHHAHAHHHDYQSPWDPIISRHFPADNRNYTTHQSAFERTRETLDQTTSCCSSEHEDSKPLAVGTLSDTFHRKASHDN